MAEQELDDALEALNYIEAGKTLQKAVDGVRSNLNIHDGDALLTEDGWLHLKTLVTFKNPLILCECAWLLIAFSAYKNDQVIDRVGWANIMRVVRANKSAGILLLGTLAMNDKKGNRILKEQLPYLLGLAQSSSEKPVWGELAAAFSYIALADKGAIALTQKGIAAIIVSFLSENDSNLTRDTLMLIHNLTLTRSHKVKLELAKQGLLKALIPFTNQDEFKDDACILVARLGVEPDDSFIQLIKSWLESENTTKLLAGLQGLISSSSYRDLILKIIPTVFEQLESIVENSADNLQIVSDAKTAIQLLKSEALPMYKSMSFNEIPTIPSTPSDNFNGKLPTELSSPTRSVRGITSPPPPSDLPPPSTPPPYVGLPPRIPTTPPPPAFDAESASTPIKEKSPKVDKGEKSKVDKASSKTKSKEKKRKEVEDEEDEESRGQKAKKPIDLPTEQSKSEMEIWETSPPKTTKERLDESPDPETKLKTKKSDKKFSGTKLEDDKSKPTRSLSKKRIEVTSDTSPSSPEHPSDISRTRSFSKSEAPVDKKFEKVERSRSSGTKQSKLRPQSMSTEPVLIEKPSSPKDEDEPDGSVKKEKKWRSTVTIKGVQAKQTDPNSNGSSLSERKLERKAKKKKASTDDDDVSAPEINTKLVSVASGGIPSTDRSRDIVADSFEMLSKKESDPLNALKRLLTVNNTELFLKEEYLAKLLDVIKTSSNPAVVTLVLNLLATISRQNKTAQELLLNLSAISVYSVHLTRPESAVAATIAMGSLCYGNKQVKDMLASSTDAVNQLKLILADPKTVGEACASIKDIVEGHTGIQELLGGDREVKSITELLYNCTKKTQLRHIFGLISALVMDNQRLQNEFKHHKVFPKLFQYLKEHQDDGVILTSLLVTLRVLCDNNVKNVDAFFNEKPAKDITALLSYPSPDVQAETCNLVTVLVVVGKGKKKKLFVSENITNSLKLLDLSPTENVRKASNACLKVFQDDSD